MNHPIILRRKDPCSTTCRELRTSTGKRVAHSCPTAHLGPLTATLSCTFGSSESQLVSQAAQRGAKSPRLEAGPEVLSSPVTDSLQAHGTHLVIRGGHVAACDAPKPALQIYSMSVALRSPSASTKGQHSPYSLKTNLLFSLKVTPLHETTRVITQTPRAFSHEPPSETSTHESSLTQKGGHQEHNVQAGLVRAQLCRAPGPLNPRRKVQAVGQGFYLQESGGF